MPPLPSIVLRQRVQDAARQPSLSMTNQSPIPARPPASVSTGVTPRFVTGSIMRHVAVMASAGAIGLIAIFLVDLINLFYLSRLDNKSITAGPERSLSGRPPGQWCSASSRC